MNEKYVTDLEHSRKLVAAGWTKETEFYHRVFICEGAINTFLIEDLEWQKEHDSHPVRTSYFFAPLTDELLEEFSITVRLERCKGRSYAWLDTGTVMDDKILPNALADLWIWWKERGTDTKLEYFKAESVSDPGKFRGDKP